MSNIQTGAERMPHDLSHLGFLAGQIGRLRSEERFSRNAETDLVCRLLLEKKKKDMLPTREDAWGDLGLIAYPHPVVRRRMDRARPAGVRALAHGACDGIASPM